MEEMSTGMMIYSILSTLITIVCGGGWFINWRAKKRQENAKAKQDEADAFKSMQDAYQQMHEDLLARLKEVCDERDHYKDERDEERKANRELRQKYKELDERMTKLDMQYRRDISRLGRRIDVLSPFLCGLAGCLNRKKVSLMENIDDNSFATEDERENDDKTTVSDIKNGED